MKLKKLGVLVFFVGTTYGMIRQFKKRIDQVEMEQARTDKFRGYYDVLNRWLMIRQEGRSLEEFFVENNYKTLAIYGMGELGRRLYQETKNYDSVDVKYGIDANEMNFEDEFPVRKLSDTLEKVDVVVVTAIADFDDIEIELQEYYDCPIISLADMIEQI